MVFTGIIERQGVVEEVRTTEGFDIRLSVPKTQETDPDFFKGSVKLGDSIAVNGVCLTAIEILPDDSCFFNLMPETLKLTNLSEVKPGSVVNLERAMALGDRISGHYVLGHVDFTAEIVGKQVEADALRITFQLPNFQHREALVFKGCVAIDGISLTVASVCHLTNQFTVCLIRYTQSKVNLAGREIGERVNIELDYQKKNSGSWFSTQGVSLALGVSLLFLVGFYSLRRPKLVRQ